MTAPITTEDREAAEDWEVQLKKNKAIWDIAYIKGFQYAVELLRSDECFQYFFDGIQKPVPDEARNVADWLETKFKEK